VFQEAGDEPTILVYMNKRSDRRFDCGRLMQKASADFDRLKDQEALQKHEKHDDQNKLFQRKNSIDHQVVETPDQLMNALQKTFEFDFDPVPVRPKHDALKLKRWGSVNYVNPPFAHAAAFCFHAVRINEWTGAKTVVICPTSIGSRWREELDSTGHVNAVIFLRSGIKFKGYETQIGLSMYLLLIGDKRDEPSRVFFWDPLTKLRRQASESRDVAAFLRSVGW
jgi:hypothetical protein